jgi:hypothetical protein
MEATIIAIISATGVRVEASTAIRWAASLSLLLSARVAAQSGAITEIPVRAPPFTEHLDETIPTAGGRIIGMQSGDPLGKVDRSVITISGLKPSDTIICVSIQHVNGAYYAGFTQRVEKHGPIVRFVLPSTKVGGFSARTAELAILAQTGRNGRCGENDPILPATWGRYPSTGDSYVLINDRKASITRVSFAGQAFLPCKRLRDNLGERVALRAYQVSCPIQRVVACVTDAPLVVQFVERGGRSSIRSIVRGGC